MSLGSWFRDYLYIPLGGNRVSKLKWFRNIFIVWMATGLWHGAAWNFIVWGLLFGILLVNEKIWLLKKLSSHRIASRVYVLFFIVISFIIFDAEDMGSAISLIGQMFGAGNIPAVNTESLWYLKNYIIVIVAAAVGATPLISECIKKLSVKKFWNKLFNILEPVYILVLLSVSTAFLVDGSFNPFLYFRF